MKTKPDDFVCNVMADGCDFKTGDIVFIVGKTEKVRKMLQVKYLTSIFKVYNVVQKEEVADSYGSAYGDGDLLMLCTLEKDPDDRKFLEAGTQNDKLLDILWVPQ
tara:strand:- start:2089 stop:2403 length:315 start_codon:yes stop_codon:yes gene_type:complete